MKKIRSRALIWLTAVAAAFGIALVGLPASPAAAAAWCELRINPADNDGHPGSFWVIIEGETSLPALSLSVSVHGDDEWFDDFITSWDDSTASYHWVTSALVTSDDLDEDWDGRDEIYAKVTARFYNNTVAKFTTSNVYGWY